MVERPKIIDEISRALFINASVYITGALIMLPVIFLAWHSITALVLPLLLDAGAIVVGTYYATLGWGFRNHRPWAYRPTFDLVQSDRLSRALGFDRKIHDPEIRRAFGLEDR